MRMELFRTIANCRGARPRLPARRAYTFLSRWVCMRADPDGKLGGRLSGRVVAARHSVMFGVVAAHVAQIRQARRRAAREQQPGVLLEE